MKVYVRLGNGAKELYDDLSAVSPRVRAERLRVLASIGLSVVQGGNTIPHASNSEGSQSDHLKGSEPDVSHESNLASKLMGSLK